VPAVWNLKSKVAPGFKVPEAHTFVFDVASCAIVSLLVHRTVVPTGIVSGLGLNALAPSVRAFTGIETGVLPVPGAGVVGVVGDVDEYPPPHATISIETIVRRLSRKDVISCLPLAMGESNCAAVFDACDFRQFFAIVGLSFTGVVRALREMKTLGPHPWNHFSWRP
jgi:hypothetical protein